MAKRWWSGMWARSLGAVAMGAAVLVGLPGGALGQGLRPNPTALEEARRLNSEVLKLHGEGKFDAAVPLAERALAIGQKELGPDHSDVATLLNLAELYRGKGEYAHAEPLYQRALAIQERKPR